MMTILHTSVRQYLRYYCRNTRTSKTRRHFLCRGRSFDQEVFRSFSSPHRDNQERSSIEDTKAQEKHTFPGVSVTRNGSRVVISFDKKDQLTFHAPWLWSNDPACVHPTSGQRLRTPGGYSKRTRIESAAIINPANESIPSGVVLPFPPPPKGSSHPIGNLYVSNDDVPNDALCLKVTWKTATQASSQSSYFDLDWLKQWRYDEEAFNKRRARTIITPVQALQSDGKIPSFDYQKMEENSEEFAFQLLSAIVESGAGLVQNAPISFHDSTPPVAEIGCLLGGSLSHGALYGDIFHVKSVPDAHNIAYTSVPLGPHQDLAYYESKPGLQLLHCLSNKGVEGGESILMDALAAAEEFRRLAPEYFDTLTKCPATFVKQREGADMMYRRPHIVLDDAEDIVSVNWSPPFEGPLSVSSGWVGKYYVAYAAFERMLDNSLPKDYGEDDLHVELYTRLRVYAQKYTWKRRLEPGEILIFNNLRMLHGRRGFTFAGESGGRHLLGCYTNIDDTLNRFRVLRRERSSDVPIRNVGNGTCGIP